MTQLLSSDLSISKSVKPHPIQEIALKNGIDKSEIEYHGSYKAKIKLSILERIQGASCGKYVVCTGITPTPLGEGKSTTTIGVSQALGAHLGRKVFTTIRQPSLGPMFGIKGGAAGGGYSQVIPMTTFNLNYGDISAVTAGNNLIAAALDSRMIHEQTQTTSALYRRLTPSKNGVREFAPPFLKRLKKLGISKTNPEDLTEEEIERFSRLDVDPSTITWKRVDDTCDRSLREIEINLSPTEYKVQPLRTGFDISVASELMAILALCKYRSNKNAIEDMRERVGRIIVSFSKHGDPVTVEDLGCAGAVAVLLADALMPTLMQTIEQTPVLVHCGPFANIAHGNSSIIADQIALNLVGDDGFCVTESGFGADIGFEKFCNIKCRESGIFPNCAILVVTVRSIKSHGGGPLITPGQSLPNVYSQENFNLIFKGIKNMQKHIENIKKFQIPVVVALNKFSTDTSNEIKIVCKAAEEAGAFRSVCCKHWEEGGKGAVELAQAVIDCCSSPVKFNFLYSLELSLKEKAICISKNIYGATKVEFSDKAEEQLTKFEAHGYGRLPICIAKTHLSFTCDSSIKIIPSEFTVRFREARASIGAGFIYLLSGSITTIPGLPTFPGFLHIDLLNNGEIIGLF